MTNGSWKKWLRPTWVSSLLFWNPLITAGFTFVFSGMHAFLASWLVSLIIADACMLQCQVVLRVFLAAERRYCAWRGRAAKVRSTSWSFFAAAVVMPFTLPLGFAAGQWVAGLFGVHWGAADSRSYRIGLGFGGGDPGALLLSAHAHAKP